MTNEVTFGAWPKVVNRILSPDHLVGRALMSARIRAQLLGWRPGDEGERRVKTMIGRVAPAFTMVDLTRLRLLVRLASDVHTRKVPGCVVECGTWKGGGLALMDWALREHGDRRTLWGFDSFEGLPAPSANDDVRSKRMFFDGWCAASPADVQRAFDTVGGGHEQLRIVRGWLSDTLSASETGPIALLNVDVDWYESVKITLDLLYERVSAGGVVNIDDFGRWAGCDLAVHEFLASHGLARTVLNRTGRHGAWFVKP
jgi:O-methyltransferase